MKWPYIMVVTTASLERFDKAEKCNYSLFPAPPPATTHMQAESQNPSNNSPPFPPLISYRERKAKIRWGGGC